MELCKVMRRENGEIPNNSKLERKNQQHEKAIEHRVHHQQKKKENVGRNNIKLKAKLIK